jgi:hypothetical protein
MQGMVYWDTLQWSRGDPPAGTMITAVSANPLANVPITVVRPARRALIDPGPPGPLRDTIVGSLERNVTWSVVSKTLPRLSRNVTGTRDSQL